MALPPEPLQDVLPQAALVVDAEVTEVVSTGPAAQNPKVRPGTTSAGLKAPAQVVKLKVKRVLFSKAGAAPTEVVVHKPEAGYSLKAGNKGPFLLDASSQPRILGRYGPDSYDFPTLEKAIKKQ